MGAIVERIGANVGAESEAVASVYPLVGSRALKKILKVLVLLLVFFGVFGLTHKASAQGAPWIHVDPQHNWVSAHDFTSGATLTFKVFKGGIEVASVDRAADANGHYFLDGFEHGQDIVAGDEVRVTDGGTTKSLLVKELLITQIDPGTEVVSGMSTPGETVDVHVNDPPDGGGATQSVLAGLGLWSADFTGTFDITASTHARAQIEDGDGDATVADKQPPAVHGDLSFDHVNGHQFAPNTTVSLTISDDAGTLYGPTDITTDDFGNFFIDRSAHNIDLVPGLTIEATQGGTTKSLVLVPLSITEVNPSNDTVTGTTDPTVTPPGSTVGVGVGDESGGAGRQVTTAADGTWVADFSTGPDAFDITGTTGAQADIGDDDGDATIFGKGVAQILGDLSFDNVNGHQFAPTATVSLSISDSSGALFGPADITTDEFGNFFVDRDAHGVDLVPGLTIEATQGGTTKTLVLVPLSITEVNPSNDTVTGTTDPTVTPPGTTVKLGVGNESGSAGRWVTTATDGTWVADFSTGTGDDFFTLEFDITGTTNAQADINDDDGDATTFGKGVPSVHGSLSFDGVEGHGFTPDSTVSLTISDGAGTLYGPTDVTTDQFGSFFVDRDAHGVDLVPGLTIEATEGGTTKTLQLVNLSITAVDPTDDTVTGTADPDPSIDVEVHACDESGCANRLVSPDATTGIWVADFSTGPDAFDIAGIQVGANIRDDDGDSTSYDRGVASFEGNLAFDSASGCDFALDSSVTVIVKDGPGGNELFNDSRPTDGNGCFDAHFGFDLVPGMYISVFDGGATKELTLVTLTIDNIDLDNDTVSGTAPPNTTFNVDFDTVGDGSGWVGQDVTSDGTGAWTADFGALGLDLTLGNSHVGANIADEDGDQTATDASVPNPRVIGDLNFNNIDLEEFEPDSTVTLAISDGTGNLFGPADFTTDESGHAFIDGSEHGVDLVPGITIQVARGTLTKTVELVPLTIAQVNPANDTVTGSASPDAEVSVHVCNHETETCAQRDVTADATTGVWVADFSAGPDSLNITAGSDLWASIFDNDADETRFYWGAPQLRVELLNHGGHVTANGYAPETTLTFEIYDAPNGNLLFSGNQTVDEFGEARLGPDTHGQDLQPGMFVRVTDGVLAKEHEIRFLTIDGVDPLTERVRGEATPGDVVGVFAENEDGEVFVEIEAGGDGVWIADLSGQIELRHPNTHLDAHLFDEDGDATSSFGSVPWIDVEPETDSIRAHGFPSEAPITYEVYDTPGGSLLGSSTVTADQDGEAQVELADHGQDIAVGTFVRVTDGFGTKEHEVVPLTVDVANPTTNVAAGTASPGDLVHVDIPFLIDVQKCCPDQQDTAAADGSWSVDFTGVEDEDVPGDLFEPANVAVASISDDDGDRTQVSRPATEEAFETAAAGQTVTTDPEADGAKFEDPVETSLTTPVAGDVSIAETQGSSATADTFSFLGYEIDLNAPTATVDDPLVIVFTIDESLIPDGEDASTIQIFRNETFVSACLDPSSQTADPNPCVFARQNVADGDAQITVLTTDASLWEFGVSDDATDPTIGAPSFSVNPKAISETSDMTAEAAEGGGSGLAGGEYFVDDDPGQGDGTPMALSGSTLSATIGTDLSPGVYLIGVRAQDRAGNWSAVSTAYLVVYDPSSGFATGGGWIVPGGPNSDPGDLLPGLDGSSKANFGFVVKYDNGASTVPGGNLEFHYNVGKFHLRSAAMEWLVVTNSNWAKFQGSARIDGSDEFYPFRVDARDGDSAGTTDRFIIKVYEPGADPDAADPVYKASGDVQGGQIKIHSSR